MIDKNDLIIVLYVMFAMFVFYNWLFMRGYFDASPGQLFQFFWNYQKIVPVGLLERKNC